MKALGRFLLVAIVVAAAFGGGIAFHRSKAFPYPELLGLYRGIAHPEAGVAALALKQQYVRDARAAPIDRAIDTALLPLRVTGLRASETVGFPKTGGAIAAAGKSIILLDRLGNLYQYRPGDTGGVVAAGLPPVPMNADAYLRTPGTSIDSGSFRSYDIAYIPQSGYLVASHEVFDPESQTVRMAVSRLRVALDPLSAEGGWTTIWQGSPEPDRPNDCSGGRILVQTPERLLLTIGDYLIAGRPVAQDPDSFFGKIVEIDLADGSSRILSSGHRNPQGLTALGDGTILATEHGPSGGDELNRIEAGQNYGWPVVSYGTDYGAYGLGSSPSPGRHDGFRPPVFAWVPSIGVSNLLQVRDFDPRWDGDLLVASLKAQTLFRLRLDAGHVVYSEPIWIGQRIRDIAQVGNGEIALWTDDSQLLFLSIDRDRLQAVNRPEKVANQTVADGCLYCHHFGPTSPADPAPSLSGIVGRQIAADNFRYSPGLRAVAGTWTAETLRTFLADPGAFANGTGMPQLNLPPDEINAIVRFLETE